MLALLRSTEQQTASCRRGVEMPALRIAARGFDFDLPTSPIAKRG
jgi:hypothetical protein